MCACQHAKVFFFWPKNKKKNPSISARPSLRHAARALFRAQQHSEQGLLWHCLHRWISKCSQCTVADLQTKAGSICSIIFLVQGGIVLLVQGGSTIGMKQCLWLRTYHLTRRLARNRSPSTNAWEDCVYTVDKKLQTACVGRHSQYDLQAFRWLISPILAYPFVLSIWAAFITVCWARIAYGNYFARSPRQPSSQEWLQWQFWNLQVFDDAGFRGSMPFLCFFDDIPLVPKH